MESRDLKKELIEKIGVTKDQAEAILIWTESMPIHMENVFMTTAEIIDGHVYIDRNDEAVKPVTLDQDVIDVIMATLRNCSDINRHVDTPIFRKELKKLTYLPFVLPTPDVSFLWHCVDHILNISDYSAISANKNETKNYNLISKVVFRKCLRRLERVGVISLEDIDRDPKPEDQEKWNNIFNSPKIFREKN